MARRTDTRERMVRTAAELFHAQGYHATGLNQVLAAGGAPKGSLYFHFPGGKEQLAAEAVTLAGDELCAALKSVMADAPTPIAALERVLDLLGRRLVTSDYTNGCPISTVALDASAESEPIREACVAAYASWRQAIADHLDRADAAEVATVVLAAIEGAVLLARTLRDLSPLHAVATHLGVLLGRPTG